MLAVIVRLEVKPETVGKFLEAISANSLASVRDEPGCHRFDVMRLEDSATAFVLYEVYEDHDAFDAHRATAHYREWRAFADSKLDSGAQTRTQAEIIITR